MINTCKIYSVTATKGGVGKTTKTANIGAIIADMNQRVLLVDADPQQSLSLYFDVTERSKYGLTQLFKTANSENCISKTSIPGLDIIVNDDPGGDTGQIASFLRESMTHFTHLRFALEALQDQYDYIFIDSQGAKGVIQESVILAADSLLIPITPDLLATRVVMNETVHLVHSKFHPKTGFPAISGRKPPSVKILINKWDRTNASQEITAELRQFFSQECGDIVTVLPTVIPNLQVYKNSVALKIPVHRLEQKRTKRTKNSAPAAFFTMLNLVTDLEPRLMGLDPTWKKAVSDVEADKAAKQSGEIS